MKDFLLGMIEKKAECVIVELLTADHENNDCIIKKKTKKSKNNYNLGKNVHFQSDLTHV